MFKIIDIPGHGVVKYFPVSNCKGRGPKGALKFESVGDMLLLYPATFGCRTNQPYYSETNTIGFPTRRRYCRNDCQSLVCRKPLTLRCVRGSGLIVTSIKPPSWLPVDSPMGRRSAQVIVLASPAATRDLVVNVKPLLRKGLG